MSRKDTTHIKRSSHCLPGSTQVDRRFRDSAKKNRKIS